MYMTVMNGKYSKHSLMCHGPPGSPGMPYVSALSPALLHVSHGGDGLVLANTHMHGLVRRRGFHHTLVTH